MELVNLTNYAVAQAVMLDGTGREALLVAVKATFAIDGGAPRLVDEQEPLMPADQYAGEPDASSLRRAGEMALFKPSADVVLTGCAYTVQGRRTETQVMLQVASLSKTVRVTGDRVWGGLTGISPPEPFARMELSYERAFGGKDVTSEPPDACAENPVGVGFRGKKSQLPVSGARLPNLENPAQLVGNPGDRPVSHAFGPIAPSWHPRRVYAGTYDERWRRERMPFPPADFDPRHQNTASPDQVLPGYLVGGERVRIAGVRPEGGGYGFALPAFRPQVVVRIGDRREVPELRCDTLAIDAEAQQFSLVARAVVDVQGKLAGLRWTKIEEGPRG
jgi:hypothetical protein